MRKDILLRGSLAAALGLFILTANSADARRVHDPNTATKVHTERGTDASTDDFRARISNLLKQAEEAEEAEQHPPLSVPKTLSEYDTAIIGTPLASQERCVE